MQGTQAICFDLFTTLVNVGRVPIQVGGFTADILGVDRKRWNEACFGPHHEIRKPSTQLENLRRIAHSLDPSIPETAIQRAAQARQARFDHALQHGVEVKVLEILRRLRTLGYKLALISNASSAEVQAWHSSPLAELFGVVVFSCETGYCKPEPGIYQHALGQLGEPADNCLFVGDGGSDEHLGAAAVGMKPVLLSHYLERETCRKRHRYYQHVLATHITTLDELLVILEKTGNSETA